jgi:glutathione S-transferase
MDDADRPTALEQTGEYDASVPVLYWSPGACSLAPHILVEELGIACRLELVWSRDGRMTNTSEWRAVNPKGRIPAFYPVPGWSGGKRELLTEASAILVYLAMAHPDAGFIPADPARFARCVEWTNWLSSAVHGQAFGQIWRAHRVTDDPRAHEGIRARGLIMATEQFTFIEHILADGRDWSEPGGYSIVDPYLLVFHRWGSRVGIDMERFPQWGRTMERVMARPAVQRALAREARAEADDIA